MKAIVDLCVVPIGVGVSVSRYVAACERVLKEAGLETRLHAYGTNIEGEWDAVFAAITTLAPSLAARRAIAKPIPRLPPDMKIVFAFNDMVISLIV